MPKLCFALLSLLLVIKVSAQSIWPREIPLSGAGKLTIYQPQPEKLSGNKLWLRAAFSYVNDEKVIPAFGTLWAHGIVQSNNDSRTLELESIAITRLKFADTTATEAAKRKHLIETGVATAKLVLSNSDLLAFIEKNNQAPSADLKMNAPIIIYTTQPSTLIVTDGEPVIKPDKAFNNVERIVNTPFHIFRNHADSSFYLYGGNLWYRSLFLLSGWEYVRTLPASLKTLDNQLKALAKKNNPFLPAVTLPQPTQIIFSTVPAELIQTVGEASFVPIENTSLLYAKNSPDQLFKDTASQQVFVLIAGRWYSAPAIDGAWSYVAADKLPPSFAAIPPGSQKDAVLVSVAGTTAAAEALLDAQIPQTAKVDRQTVTCTIAYDGDPRFVDIDNTNLQLAENSDKTVLRSSENNYYAVDKGIWFVSNKPTGKWEVAIERPLEVDNIPPQNPAYNSRYVHVYDHTTSHVYVGYTAGYLGSYIYGPTVVWGTGWQYFPWQGNVYYPRPCTWGFGMQYNPLLGWSFGYSYLGWFNVEPPTGAWFWATDYRPPYTPHHSGSYYPYFQNNPPDKISRKRSSSEPPALANVNHTINRKYSSNLYSQIPGVIIRRISSPTGHSNHSTTPRPMLAPLSSNNNVFADTAGHIFKKDGKTGAWLQLSRQAWIPVNNLASLPELDKHANARDKAAARDRDFYHYFPDRNPEGLKKSSRKPATKQVARPARLKNG